MPGSFRLAVTADLHHDVARSRGPAERLAAQWRRTAADALLVVGDAATSDAGFLEEALSLFEDDGRPRLFVPGNHEFWAKRRPKDVRELLYAELPRRVRAAGWHWLPGRPFAAGDVAIVGTSGWYDYAFADGPLGLPERFYRAKQSPGAAAALTGDELNPGGADVPERARAFRARWNDGRNIHGIRDDRLFCREVLATFSQDLGAVGGARAVVAAVHVVPDAELLPPRPPGEIPERALKYAFARAYLGSPAFGEAALARANVRHVVCGHSHVGRSVRRGGVQLTNVGSDYERKRWLVIDL